MSSRIDPFVLLTVSGDPPLWSHTTDVQADKASLAEWAINSSREIVPDLLSGRTLTIIAKDRKAKDKVIGESTISLKSLISKGNNWSTIDGRLIESSTSKVSGEYSLRMRYRVSSKK
jgi:hypothetical protein